MSDKKELTIEEKAREYADNLIYPHCFLEIPKLKRASNNLVSASYRSGYNEALSIFRWRKVEEEMPSTNIDVIGKCKEGNFYICSYGKYSKTFILDSEDDAEIVEWRPIN